MSTRSSKQKETALATKFIAGIQLHLANVPSLTFESASHTPQELVTAFKALVDLRAAVDDAKVAEKAKLAAEEAQRPAILVLMDGFEAYVKLTFSKQPDVLAAFGLAPKKVATPLTAEQKAAANAKRAATRKARGTAGKKQKKGIKGDVVGVVVTPVTSAPAPAASNAPSAPVPTGGATGGSTGHGAA